MARTKETKIMAEWEKSLAQIEEQSRNMLKKHILGDGGNPKSNSVIAIVNHHVGEARNALQGSMD
jgi:hypothetical protein